MKERSLITFTLLSQLAVGIFITLLVSFIWFLSFAGSDQAIRWCTPGLLGVAGSMLAATITSFLHLGNPRNSWRAASHFRSSWLSREIILVIVFTGITVLIASLVGLRIPLHTVLYILGAAGAIVGAGLVYVMGRIYCQRTVPAWNTWQTLAHFILATLAMGVVGTSLLLALNGDIPYTRLLALGRLLGAGLMAFLLLQIVTLFFWLTPADKTMAYREALRLITGKHRWILTAYLSLICLAILASSALIASSYRDSRLTHIAILCLTVLFVYAAEFFGRGLFYFARVRQGV